jgi:hypothetical protein
MSAKRRLNWAGVLSVPARNVESTQSKICQSLSFVTWFFLIFKAVPTQWQIESLSFYSFTQSAYAQIFPSH